MQSRSNTVRLLISPHTRENTDIWFQEEARAERLANLVRILYTIIWIIITTCSAWAQPIYGNIGNVGLGLVWMAYSLFLHIYLRRFPYRPFIKYLSTTLDVLIITGMLFVYHYDMGYSTTLKSIPFVSYFFVLILATFRFNVRLPIYGGILTMLSYGTLLLYMVFFKDVEFGSMIEEFTTSKVNLLQQLYRIFYLASLTILMMIFVLNIRRLVHIRVQESEKALKEKNEREKRQAILERYFSTEMANYLLLNPQELGGKTRKVTVMICDLRGFTTLSENLGAARSLELLNRLFSELVGIVFEYGGTLDKFLGDGMLVVFGIPNARSDDALRAVRAAKALLRRARELGQEYDIDMGIAINTGDVIFGNIGSEKRMEFTIIGDTVNTVSRMEALNKEFDSSIIISETTYYELGGLADVRELPVSHLRGKSGSVHMYEVRNIA